MRGGKMISKLFVGACAIFMAVAVHAAELRPLGGTGTVPTPFDLMNRRAELADGEYYLLSGSVTFAASWGVNGLESRPYFEVDLKEQSWLASEKRKKNPYYPLEGPLDYWKGFAGKRLRLPCQAIAKIEKNSQGEEVYVIYLRAGAGS